MLWSWFITFGRYICIHFLSFYYWYSVPGRNYCTKCPSRNVPSRNVPSRRNIPVLGTCTHICMYILHNTHAYEVHCVMYFYLLFYYILLYLNFFQFSSEPRHKSNTLRFPSSCSSSTAIRCNQPWVSPRHTPCIYAALVPFHRLALTPRRRELLPAPQLQAWK